MSLKIGKEKMDKLYALEKHGVPLTHLECLIWFHVNTGKIVDIDTARYDEILNWITELGIKTLNIAGNRESGNPGIKSKVYRYLINLFKV